MFRNWNWTRIMTGAVGILTLVGGLVFPPLAAVTTPIGAGIVGLALKAPGTFTATDLAGHAHSVASAAAGAAVQSLAAGGGLDIKQMGKVASDAAARALAVVPPPGS